MSAARSVKKACAKFPTPNTPTTARKRANVLPTARMAAAEGREAEVGERVAGDADGVTLADPIAHPARDHLDCGGKAVGDTLDQTHRIHGRADPRGEKEWKDRKDHLVVGIGGQVGGADRHDVPVEPGPSLGQLAV